MAKELVTPDRTLVIQANKITYRIELDQEALVRMVYNAMHNLSKSSTAGACTVTILEIWENR